MTPATNSNKAHLKSTVLDIESATEPLALVNVLVMLCAGGAVVAVLELADDAVEFVKGSIKNPLLTAS